MFGEYSFCLTAELDQQLDIPGHTFHADSALRMLLVLYLTNPALNPGSVPTAITNIKIKK
jgi:hypothetical protein